MFYFTYDVNIRVSELSSYFRKFKSNSCWLFSAVQLLRPSHLIFTPIYELFTNSLQCKMKYIYFNAKEKKNKPQNKRPKKCQRITLSFITPLSIKLTLWHHPHRNDRAKKPWPVRVFPFDRNLAGTRHSSSSEWWTIMHNQRRNKNHHARGDLIPISLTSSRPPAVSVIQFHFHLGPNCIG